MSTSVVIGRFQPLHNEHVRLLTEAKKISDNIAAFGMGSKLLQEVSRDDYNFAMKVSNIVKQGVSVPVYKQPKTDASKASKFGKFSGYGLEPVYTHEIPNVNPAIRYSKFPDVIDRANKDFGADNV